MYALMKQSDMILQIRLRRSQKLSRLFDIPLPETPLGYLEHSLFDLEISPSIVGSADISDTSLDDSESIPNAGKHTAALPTPDPTPIPEAPLRTAIHRDTAAIDQSNIIEGRRNRRPSEKAVQVAASSHHQAYQILLNTASDHAIENTYLAFNTMIMPTPTTPIQPASDLPPPPNNWKEMLAHPLATQFRAAAQLEWILLQSVELMRR
jgi:hypothetical protein